jgi:hypothetical protein
VSVDPRLEGLDPGDLLPDLTAISLGDRAPVRLSALVVDDPLLLVFGSFT